VVSADIKTWADLKGKTVMLGTKQDITAIVLAQLAAPHGLKLDDFSIAIGGNSASRYAALMSGNAQATILVQPFDLMAQSKGMKIMASAIDTMKEWPLAAIAVNPAWAASHRPTVVKFMRAMRRAAQYGYTHKADVVDALVAGVHVDAPTAEHAFDDNWTRWHAYDPGQKFTQANLQYIARLQMGMGIMTAIPPYSDVYDGSYIAEIR
jgi:ABC-type nitrate/sulfonate/bicarbonate transport system substrate-binding protein